MTSRTSILMLLAIAVVGIYVLPAVTARFAGTHSVEFNTTDRIGALQCEKCHDYIISEFGASDASMDVLSTHLLAAAEPGYVNDSGILNITETGSFASDANRSACMLCHLITRNVTGGLNVTHTKITIRVCTDDQCHGAGVEDVGQTTVGGVTGYTWASDALNVTQKLAQPEDVHSKFFIPLDGERSNYVDQQGVGDGSGNYSRGFLACMACHTHLGVSFNLTRPTGIIFNFTTNLDSGGMILGFSFDTMSLNQTNQTVGAIKGQGVSIWS